MRQFIHFVLVEPDRIGIASDELVDRDTVDGWFALDAFLFSTNEDSHVLTTASRLFGLLLGREFAFWFAHLISSGDALCSIVDMIMVSPLGNSNG